MTRRRTQAGALLADLAIAIAVSAILAGAALVRLGGSTQAGAAVAVESMVSLLSQARASAIAAGRPATVSIGPSGASACWSAPCSPAGPNASPVSAADGSALRSSFNGFPLTGAPSSVDFDATGAAFASASFAIGAVPIAVDAATGVASRPGSAP